jgi:hypothetical protein
MPVSAGDDTARPANTTWVSGTAPAARAGTERKTVRTIGRTDETRPGTSATAVAGIKASTAPPGVTAAYMAMARLSDVDPDVVAGTHTGRGADRSSLTAARMAGIGARRGKRGERDRPNMRRHREDVVRVRLVVCDGGCRVCSPRGP